MMSRPRIAEVSQREDRAGYMRAWRARNPDKVARDYERLRLRDRAMRELARRHPAELEAIMAELAREKKSRKRH